MDRWNLPRDPLLALQQGDPAPFEDFVRAHARTLIAFFRQRGATPARAEDLSQEVFLKLYQGAERYRPEERFASYCFRVARNAWIDECRRVGVRPEFAASPPDGEGLEPETEPADPAEGLIAHEEQQSLRKLLATLPETHRVVFELAILGELGYSEIAQHLGIPEGTVKSRMFYAVRRLRVVWEAAREGAAGATGSGEEGAA